MLTLYFNNELPRLVKYEFPRATRLADAIAKTIKIIALSQLVLSSFKNVIDSPPD